MRVSSLPCIYIFVVEMTPGDIYEQESAARDHYSAALKIIDQGSNYATLEKIIYRYTDALYQMLRADMFLSASGWAISNISKAYSATEATDPLLKAGQVSFTVTVEDVSA